MKVGDPVDLSDLLELTPTPAVTQQATDRIMAAITALVEEIRNDRAPAERFDVRKAGVPQIGNPNKPRKKERP